MPTPMPRQIPWFERAFPVGADPRLAAEAVARLAGAPATFAWLAEGLSNERLTKRVAGGWSIQENIAHLADLDRVLHLPRIEQFRSGVEVLVPADVNNATTNEASHNERPIADVLADFIAVRAKIIHTLEEMPLEYFARSALHERLGVRMQLIDLCVFFAEHDDSHAARVRELIAITA